MTPLLRDLLSDVLQEYRNQHPKVFKLLREKYPKTIDFTLNETNREIIYRLQNFEDIVNEYILHQSSKYLDANNYLKRTLLIQNINCTLVNQPLKNLLQLLLKKKKKKNSNIAS